MTIIMELYSVCTGSEGCSKVLRIVSGRFSDSDNEEEILQHTASVFQAVDKRDKDAVKELSAPNVVRRDKDDIKRYF